ncbi:uncharacterized protein LOC127859920 [Dreissena polymorpha]|nr:uncharacterized protein LOC127859920 [Dreissena polymorpha]
MSWQGLLGIFLLFNQSIKSEQFTLSNDSTRWPLSSCDLAEPRLVYKNTQFEVAEDIDAISNNSEAWIGFMSVKIPYLFHGCAQVQNTAQKTYSVTRIGFCQTLCGHNSPFGIKAPNGLDILYPAWLMGCICFNTSVPEIPLEHFDNDQNNLCEKDWYAIFTQISVNDSRFISGTLNTGDCLTFTNTGFQWNSCTREKNLKVICSNKPPADPSARASISAKHSSTWNQGNSMCLKEHVYPASISSILLSGLKAGQRREHWTGILKGATLLNKAGFSRFGPTQYSDVEYAFLQGSNKNINFANTGTKQALCCKATGHDVIRYGEEESLVPNYDPTTSSTPLTTSAGTSEFVTSMAKVEDNTSSVIITVASTLGSCLVVLVVIVTCLCLRRKQGNNTRTTFQQNEHVHQSNVPQGHDDNIDNNDVIPDDITEREATPYTSLQMTEKHLYTALVGPSFMSTEASHVIGRIADRDVHVETQFEMSEQQENNYDESENDDPGNTNYDDVEVSEKDIPGQTNTESEATTSYAFVNKSAGNQQLR